MSAPTASRYTILRKLGQGGMGEVFLARDNELDRDVALKFLPSGMSMDATALERLRREARAAAALNHPSVVTIHEIGVHAGRPMIAMQYVEGDPLSKIIAAGSLSVPQIVDISEQICDGLARAHAAGIIHRDLKPDNIIVDADGGVKILDFGLAKLQTAPKITQEQSTIGTLEYMSPEQIRGEEVDPRTDLFSLGAIMYEMVAGKRPFHGAHAVAVQYAILNEDPPSIADLVGESGTALVLVVERLLAKDRSARYSSARDVSAELARLSGKSITRRRAFGRTGKGPRMIVAVALVTLAAIATGVMWWHRDRSDAGSVPIAERPFVAVLPFENLGSPDDAYFAAGITEEIINRLAAVTGLGVISRTSSSQYEGKAIAQIAQDLNVQYVLEGAVRCDRTGDVSRVRITPRLVRTSDATNVWAGNYDRDLVELFDVQADIAEHVIGAMRTTLLPAESTAVALRPTVNMEAYEKYLEGMEIKRTPGANPYPLFLRATELDPNFAAPYAEISLMLSTVYGAGLSADWHTLFRAKQWLDRALELDADLPQTRYAEAYYYTCTHDYNRALASARLAKEGLPNQADNHFLMQWIRRSQGLFGESLLHIEDGLRLNPRDPNFLIARATLHEAIGDFAAADEDWQRAHSLWPMDIRASCRRSEIQIIWRGDPVAALRLVEQIRSVAHMARPLYSANALMYARDFDGALHALAPTDTFTFGARAYQFGKRFFAPGFFQGRINWLKGERAAATVWYDSARVPLEEHTSLSPKGAAVWSALAECYAGMGRKEDARRTARKGLDLCPPSVDAYMGQFRLIDLARVYVMTGDLDSALVAIEQTLPAFLTSHELELDPLYDPLRALPRFHDLIAERRKGEEGYSD